MYDMAILHSFTLSRTDGFDRAVILMTLSLITAVSTPRANK
jgi:hypothetical protein